MNINHRADAYVALTINSPVHILNPSGYTQKPKRKDPGSMTRPDTGLGTERRES
jgi:hypothetical protein